MRRYVVLWPLIGSSSIPLQVDEWKCSTDEIITKWEKPTILLSLNLPKIPRGLLWDWSWTSMLRSWCQFWEAVSMLRSWRPCWEAGDHVEKLATMMKRWRPCWEAGDHIEKLATTLRNWQPCWEAGGHFEKLATMLRNWRPCLRSWRPSWEAGDRLEKLATVLRSWRPPVRILARSFVGQTQVVQGHKCDRTNVAKVAYVWFKQHYPVNFRRTWWDTSWEDVISTDSICMRSVARAAPTHWCRHQLQAPKPPSNATFSMNGSIGGRGCTVLNGTGRRFTDMLSNHPVFVWLLLRLLDPLSVKSNSFYCVRVQAHRTRFR